MTISRRLNLRRLMLERLEGRELLHGGELALPEGESAAMPDFALTDVNPTSPRANQPVSPRDYSQQVTGWYYTHST